MTILARDVMTTDVTTITGETSVEELIHVFRLSHFTGIPVVDGDGRAVGLVSETDILRALAYTLHPPGGSGVHKIPDPNEKPTRLDEERHKKATTRLLLAANRASVPVQAAAVMRELLTRTVHDLMTPIVHSCLPDAPLADVCEMMNWKEIHRVVVVDADKKVVGLISSLDLARKFGEVLKGA